MNKKPLKTQFHLAFIFILLASVVATVITYALAALMFSRMENKLIYPANYYEKRLPAIEDYILQNKSALLAPSARQALEAEIPGRGIHYEVLDAKANRLYGTLDGVNVDGREMLYTMLNTTTRLEGRYVLTVPIIGSEGVEGAVLLSYSLNPSYVKESGNGGMTLVFIGALLSPFIYVLIFTLLFSKRFANNINKPLQLLMDAARKIKEKDLDFDISYQSDNELGRLCSAFAEMKDELGNSLSAQWRMEQERVEMVAALTHDLKAPLSIIRGYTEALLDSEQIEDGKLKRYLGVIQENADKSSGLVRQMQYTSDMERDGSTLHLETFDLIPFLERKMDIYGLEAKQREIRMILQFNEASRISLRTDGEKLERILDNVVMNSLEYTPSGGQITLSVKVHGSSACYEIWDTGAGFSSRDLEKAAQKFYRGDDARGTKEGHSGLGLYIANQLAVRLGGSLELRNRPQGGACVVFEHEGVIRSPQPLQ